jgi:tRNA-2-methylthio-N6-dimethylallyladenosine synthase
MAQKDQRLIFERAPYVDLVVGPGQLHRIPELLEGANRGEKQQLAISLARQDGSADEIRRSHESFDPLRDPSMRPTPFQAYLRIQIGCDKFCTYCVVPMTRGPEQGRPPTQIVSEAQLLAEQGAVELTLLGQTVNSYRYREGGVTTRLSDLLRQLHEIEELRRIKFVTNYPKDMTRELLETVAELPKVSPYLHVPLQSGSNRMLERMKRGYSVEDYEQMMDRVRANLPQATVSSDFIVGFCGETEEDFQQTVEIAVRRYRFKNSFIFKYSEREGTKAAERMADDVPHDIKQRWNNELLALQNKISEEENLRLLGQSFDVLVEGPSKSSLKKGETGPVRQMMGRTHCDRIVVFEGNERQTGQILAVTIYDAAAHTLFGSVVTEHLVPETFTVSLKE